MYLSIIVLFLESCEFLPGGHIYEAVWGIEGHSLPLNWSKNSDDKAVLKIWADLYNARVLWLFMAWINFFFPYFLWGRGCDCLYCTCRTLMDPSYQPRMIDEHETVDGIRVGRGTEVLGESDPMLLCPPQIPHDLTWNRTRATAVGSRLLAAWTTTWPLKLIHWVTSKRRRLE
jgi:hypothetical protein